MGVDVNKKIITGVLYSWDDLGADYIDDYFTKNSDVFNPAEEVKPYKITYFT